MRAFRDCVDDCEFKDLWFRGACLHGVGENPTKHIKERFDIFFAKTGWFRGACLCSKLSNRKAFLNEEGGSKSFKFKSL